MKKYIILLITLLLLTGCGAPKDTLSINGMYLGKKAPTDRDNLVMDASFTYEQDNVGYNVDSEDRIEYMSFHTTTNAAGDILCGLSDINLIYHGEHLDTTEEVLAYFGENYVPLEGETYASFTFEDDELIVQISLYRGEFNGITVSPR